MVRFHLSYNPYLLESSLQVWCNNTWVDISQESSLMHISNMHMQRWLEKQVHGKNFFTELWEASGDDDIEICFSGTKEDLLDLARAADAYMAINTNVQFDVKAFNDSVNNLADSAQKRRQLREVVSAAQKSSYKRAIPKDIWNYLDSVSHTREPGGKLISIDCWSQYQKSLFAQEAWELVCILIPYVKTADRSIRKQMAAFSEAFNTWPERNFDRERFFLVFSCTEEVISGDDLIHDKIKKYLLEYGLNDLHVFLLTKEEIAMLEESEKDPSSSRLGKIQDAISLYVERYAEQIRIRKIGDTVETMFAQADICEGAKLFRTIEKIYRKEHYSDMEISDAYNWTVDFANSIRRICGQIE